MKHSGRARRAAFKLIIYAFIAVVAILLVAIVAVLLGTFVVSIIPILLGAWIVFSLFTLYFFRDPEPTVPAGANIVVSPGHGKVDVIDNMTEAQFMGGECQRLSIFLSVINVHVQNAPVGGKITFYKYSTGEFMNAIRSECANCNENVLLGFEASEPAGEKVGLRLIAGVIARRIVPFVKEGDTVARGERIGLIQFGSRLDVYLPRSAKIKVNLNDNVVGGQSILAVFQ